MKQIEVRWTELVSYVHVFEVEDDFIMDYPEDWHNPVMELILTLDNRDADFDGVYERDITQVVIE